METIERYITPLKEVPAVSSDTSISAVIPKSRGSHYPVFVYDKTDKFLGMIWPYQILFREPPNKTMKVGHVVIRPPQITKDTPLYLVCEHMLGMRVYILPVFEEGRVEPVGAVSALNILQELVKDNKALRQIAEFIEYRSPLITNVHASLSDLYARMRKENQSRAVLTDSKGNIAGVISRRDIYLALIEPPPGKQRYKSRGEGKQMIFDTDWMQKKDHQVGEYATEDVLYDIAGDSLGAYLEKMLEKKRGSIVLVDEDIHPKAILSMRSFLKALTHLKPEENLPYVFTDKNRVVSAFRKMELDDLVRNMAFKISRIAPVAQIELLVDGVKNSTDRVSQYITSLHLRLSKGKTLVAKTAHSNLRTALQSAISKISRQLKK